MRAAAGLLRARGGAPPPPRGRALAAAAAAAPPTTAAAFPAAYVTLGADEARAETEAKKSRFAAWAWRVASADEALARVAARADPSASHNCFAFRAGAASRASDDSEPGGTAGRPILGAIDAEGLDGVCVLVTRYYGGVQLGAGGLVRAYSGAARAVLRAAPRVEVRPRAVVRAAVPLDALGGAHRAAEAAGAARLGEAYGLAEADGGAVELRLGVDAARAEALVAALRDASGGRVHAEVEAAAAE
jgi:putative IMPACT (imprinted ancient) family translation regulator